MRVPYAANVDVEALLDADAAPWRSTAPETLALMGTPVGLQPTGCHPHRLDRQEDRRGGERHGCGAPHRQRTRLPAGVGRSHRESRSHRHDFVPRRRGGALAVDARIVGDDDGGARCAGQRVVLARRRRQRPTRHRGRDRHEPHARRRTRARTRRLEGRPLEGRDCARAAHRHQGARGAARRRRERHGFAVAVWDGANSERGGIKAFSGDWRELVLDATKLARGWA